MKPIYLRLTAAVLSVLLTSLQVAVLVEEGAKCWTNDNVITMVKAGLPANMIVNKIHASKNKFQHFNWWGAKMFGFGVKMPR